MRRLTLSLLIAYANIHADTIDHFINIVNNIPQMEMKADQQSQAWARSARTILLLTGESIAETLAFANETAVELGVPLFCLPQAVQLNAVMLNDLIQQTYNELSSQESNKDQMTVSKIAMFGLRKQYPCKNFRHEDKPSAL